MPLNTLRLSTDLQIEMIGKLNALSKIESLLDTIVAKANRELSADACSIYIQDRPRVKTSTTTATIVAASGYQRYAINVATCDVISPETLMSRRAADFRLGLTGWVISSGRSFLAKSADDLYQHPHWLGKYDAQQQPAKKRLKLAAFLAVPLRNFRGEVIGALKAERPDNGNNKPFSVEDQIALETLGRVASRCIVYVELFVDGKRVRIGVNEFALIAVLAKEFPEEFSSNIWTFRSNL